MDSAMIAGKIDHTLLKAYASWKDIESLCEEACTYHTASVCIPPHYIKRVKDKYGDGLMLATVLRFPLGYSV